MVVVGWVWSAGWWFYSLWPVSASTWIPFGVCALNQAFTQSCVKEADKTLKEHAEKHQMGSTSTAQLQGRTDTLEKGHEDTKERRWWRSRVGFHRGTKCMWWGDDGHVVHSFLKINHFDSFWYTLGILGLFRAGGCSSISILAGVFAARLKSCEVDITDYRVLAVENKENISRCWSTVSWTSEIQRIRRCTTSCGRRWVDCSL